MKLLNMDIGVPKEIKNNEYRVGLVPAGVRTLISAGHRVYVEKAAGLGSGITDEDFSRAGAEVLGSGPEIYNRAELIVKVKEPLSVETEYIQEDQILFTFLHLAPAPELTRALLDTKCLGVAYETIQLDDGSLPLLTPMSEVPGQARPAAISDHHYLDNNGLYFQRNSLNCRHGRAVMDGRRGPGGRSLHLKSKPASIVLP